MSTVGACLYALVVVYFALVSVVQGEVIGLLGF